MKRDITVLPCVVIFVAAWVLSMIWDMPDAIRADHPRKFHILFWIMFVSGVRLAILWFQTLNHSVRRGDKDGVDRANWVLGHIFLGPISSLCYYFFQDPKTEENTQQSHVGAVLMAAPEGRTEGVRYFYLKRRGVEKGTGHL